MSAVPFIINGHFRKQQVTGVQRYALELLKEFDRMEVSYSFAEPPENISSDTLRQLWMQFVMPLKLHKNSMLWSPTNIGPVYHKNQVVTLHDIADQLYPRWFSSKYVNWRRLILPKLIKNVKGIITVSEYSKQTILEKYPEANGKIKVIYNGVRTDHFYPRPTNEVEAVKQEFNIDKPFICTVGSLDPRKNISGLIKAWNMLSSEIRAELDLVIAGGAADKFQFKLEEKVDPSVRFLGYVDYTMLPALYTASEFFVYPSLFEGFGLPVL
ncbi:MAG: glycosyltransferase family 4 protein, partial [Candidatus Halalkalibacterium sp. M3_1C_030]